MSPRSSAVQSPADFTINLNRNSASQDSHSSLAASFLMPLEGESSRANEALFDYAWMGPRRRIRRLWEIYSEQAAKIQHSASTESTFSQTFVPTVQLHTLNKWSSKFCWKERVKTFDQLQEQEDDARFAELWRQRREQIIENEYELGQRLTQMGMKVLQQSDAFIITTSRLGPARRDVNGHIQPPYEIITRRLNTTALFRLIRLTSKLQRLAAGMPDRPGGDLRDLRNLTDDQLRSLIIQE